MSVRSLREITIAKIVNTIIRNLIADTSILLQQNNKLNDKKIESPMINELNPRKLDSKNQLSSTINNQLKKISKNTNPTKTDAILVSKFILFSSFNNSNSHFKKVVSI